MSEKEKVDVESLQAQVSELTEQVRALTEERDSALDQLGKVSDKLEDARTVNQSLLNRLVSGTDLAHHKETPSPAPSLEDEAIAWYNKV